MHPNTVRVAIPRPEIHFVARFGPTAQDGLDIHVMGPRQSVHRKVIPAGLRAVSAHLHLGAPRAVLGVPTSAIAGRIVALEDLWGDAATRQLKDRLAAARDSAAATAILEREIAERSAKADGLCANTQLVLEAAARLTSANVSAVADDLGVSERHLRRLFHDTLGMSPKTFAKLTRFRRALSVARDEGASSWASIAAAAGYYDQAHLIAEFRAIAGVTPRALLRELDGGRAPQPGRLSRQWSTGAPTPPPNSLSSS